MSETGQPTKIETVGTDSVMKYTTTFEREVAQERLPYPLAPLPEPAETAMVMTNRHPVCREAWTGPVTHVEADSTHVSRLPVRIVPAFTLSVEPKQKIEEMAGEHKPFDVFVRVHSYSTKAAQVTVGLGVPPIWKSSQPVAVDFQGPGDKYVKLTVTPPQSFGRFGDGSYVVAAYAMRGEDRKSTRLNSGH